jgi:hypothetical protein
MNAGEKLLSLSFFAVFGQTHPLKGVSLFSTRTQPLHIPASHRRKAPLQDRLERVLSLFPAVVLPSRGGCHMPWNFLLSTLQIPLVGSNPTGYIRVEQSAVQ